MDLQFPSRSLFVWTTLACIGLVIQVAIGSFLFSLLLGLIAIHFGIRLIELDSIPFGGVLGLAASFLIYAVICWLHAVSLQSAGYSSGCFLYLAAGFSAGIVAATPY